MSRWKAASLYLLGCAIVASVVLAFMLLVWFPWPLFEIAGGGELAMILIGVDVVLGPLLVLIIYREGKKSLKFDLAVIVTLQLSALAYGIHAISLARPVYMAFVVDRFEVVVPKDIDAEDLAAAPLAEFKQISWGRPRYIGAQLPSDPRVSQQLMMSSLGGGKDLKTFPQYYVPYATVAGAALRRAKRLETIQKRAPEVIAGYIADSGRSFDSVRFLPLSARVQDGVVVIDAVTGEPLQILVVDPW